MRFYNENDKTKELTFNDIFLFQQKSNIKSRTEVDIKPNSPLSTTLPIISANMNSVTGKRMAEKLARLGGLGVLPQDMDLKRMLDVINYVHNADLHLDTPLTVKKEDTVINALGIINKKSHQAVIMVNKDNKPLAILKKSDLINLDQYTKLKNINIRPLITGNKGIKNEEAYNIMDQHAISSLPIVNKKGILIGIITKTDSIRNTVYSPSLNKESKLDISVALSVNGYEDKIDKLVKAGINTIFLDTAHGYTNTMIDAITDIRSKYPELIIIAGNVMNADGTEELIKAGASGVKVGIGPGAMCTTRMMTGVGRPQFSALVECSQVAKKYGAFIIADGGVRHPRDLSLAIAAGASHVMLGTTLAGTYEAPGDIMQDSEGKYKQSWGMASGKAVTGRTKQLSKFEQACRERFKEGISNAKIYNPVALGEVIDKYTTGLTSAMTYSGAINEKDFHEKALIGVQTSAGFIEGTPHGQIKK